MCGLVYSHNFDGTPVNDWIMSQFEKQRHRGTQGFGVFDGQEKNLMRTPKEKKIMSWLRRYPSSMLMFHHRIPTSTINVKKACHPFSTRDYFGNAQYVLIHNGWVTNDGELRDLHLKQGITYQSDLHDGTFNDSEALLWDMALYLEGKQAQPDAEGNLTFICMKLVDGKPHSLYFGRNSYPLNMYFTGSELSLSSEGMGGAIQNNTLYTFNYRNKTLKTAPVTFKSYTTTSRTDNGSHYVPAAYGMGYDYEDDWDETIRYKSPENSLFDDEMSPSDWQHLSSKGKKTHNVDRFKLVNGTELVYNHAKGMYLPKDDGGVVTAHIDSASLLATGHILGEMERDIKDTVYSYLDDADGHFDTAFWAMLGDQSVAQSALNSDDNDEMATTERQDLYYEIEVLARAIDVLTEDPEYDDPNSLSSQVENAKCPEPQTSQI